MEWIDSILKVFPRIKDSMVPWKKSNFCQEFPIFLFYYYLGNDWGYFLWKWQQREHKFILLNFLYWKKVKEVESIA